MNYDLNLEEHMPIETILVMYTSNPMLGIPNTKMSD